MSRPDAGNKTEPNHVRYARLSLKYNTADGKIKNLKELISKKDSPISKERYDSLISGHEKITAEMKPQLAALKKEIDKELARLNEIKINLEGKINTIESKVNESKQLYNHQIIGKEIYQGELKQYKTELDPLLAELRKNKSKISEIERAIELKSKARSSMNPNGNDTKNWENILKTKAWKKYFREVKASDSYFVRFGNTILIIQALCLLMFVVVRFLILLDLYKLILLAALGFLAVGVFVIFQFLILSSVKINAGTYFGSSIIYFFISLFLFSQVGMAFSSFDGMMADTFTGVMAFWNMIFSILIFVIGCFRTFIRGLLYDYLKR